MMNPQSYNLKESFPRTCNTLNLVLPRKYIENTTTTRPHSPNQATQSATGSEIGRIIAWRRTAERASDHCKRWRQRGWSLRRAQCSSTKQAAAAEPGRGPGGMVSALPERAYGWAEWGPLRAFWIDDLDRNRPIWAHQANPFMDAIRADINEILIWSSCLDREING